MLVLAKDIHPGGAHNDPQLDKAAMMLVVCAEAVPAVWIAMAEHVWLQHALHKPLEERCAASVVRSARLARALTEGP